MIFEPSGLPIPSEEEVRFEAQEIVQRTGWGLPLIERLRKVRDPYWREAVARCLMENWLNLVRDKDEQTYYYDSDGDMRYCWMDAECDFSRIIRRSTHEQADNEQETTEKQPKHEHRIMEQKYTQINIGTQNNNCTQIGTQINYNFYAQQDTTAQPEDIPSSVSPEANSGEEFKYIHVAVTDDAERMTIHKMVCNIVKLPKMQLICDELYKLMKGKKILCSVNPDAMLNELRRLGMPAEQDGFSQKNFQHYYRVPKMD